ncbi:MAG: class I SAM-dependent methyltransferase [Planctomycetota bacterium]|jgi:SAM-dependent methyltransferase
MKIENLIEAYIQKCYSPVRVMIGVPEILEIRNILEKTDCSKCVVDLGGGDGLAASLIGDYFDINIDIGHHIQFQENPHYNKTIVADITNIALADNSREVMTCISVLEHIEKWPLVLEGVYRVLKKDGIFIMTSPNKSFWWPKNRKQGIFKYYYKKMNHNHVRLFEIDELKNILTEIGFSKVEVYGIGYKTLGYFWMFLRPLELIFMRRLLRLIVKKLAVRNLEHFYYKGDQSTTLVGIAVK